MRCALAVLRPRFLLITFALGISPAVFAPRARALAWNFSDVTDAAGIDYTHGYAGGITTALQDQVGGVAVGDYDNDGFVDFYAVRGTIGRNVLYRNRGNGTFEERAIQAGVNITGAKGCGPAFADYDGDGWLDLFIGGIEGTTPRLFHNSGNGTFQDVTAASGIIYSGSTISTAFGDYDRDGDLDLFMTHWGAVSTAGKHMWRNNGNGTFTDVDSICGFGPFGEGLFDHSWTPNFVDVNSDDWPDLVMTEDFGESQVFLNDGDGTFTEATTGIISDENGMGSAIADYDNDGDLDWFVSSIWDPSGIPDPNWGVSGNRLYKNQGNGTFVCATSPSGVRSGYWGWGASFVDFNNDALLDLFHVNGVYMASAFWADSSRMFVGNGNGTFTETSAMLGIVDTRQGRAICCFDLERDGDRDILIGNNSQPPALYRNNGGNALNWLTLKLRGLAPNTEAIGARVYVTAAGTTQMREIRAGSNYVSQDPAEAHFGLGTATLVTQIRIEWPNGQVDVFNSIPANYYLVFRQSGMTAVDFGESTASPSVSLESAAPNPLVSSSTFRFRLETAAPVTFRIFDASGRAVRTLVDRSCGAGLHTVSWDGRDAANRSVAPGVYFYSLAALGHAEKGKISIVR
jgi:hypothetical protein